MTTLNEMAKLPIDTIPRGFTKDGKFIIPGLSMLITTECNLHCKLCSQKTSYIEAKRFSMEQIKLWIDEVFHIADYIVKLGLGGGEPLMNPVLADIVQYLNNYRSRIGSLRIVTNSTIIPSKELLIASKATQSSYLLNDYPVKNKLANIISVLEENNIEYSVRDYRSVDPYMGGWVDYGKFDRVHTIENPDKGCPRKSQYVDMYDGKLFACGVERVFMDMHMENGGGGCEGDFIELDNGFLNVQDKRRCLMDIWNKDILASCKYCNGRKTDSPRFAPGEQLTSQELIDIKKTGELK